MDAVAPTDLDEFPGALDDDRARRRSGRHMNAPPAAELKEFLCSQCPKCSKNRVAVDTEDSGKVDGRR